MKTILYIFGIALFIFFIKIGLFGYSAKYTNPDIALVSSTSRVSSTSVSDIFHSILPEARTARILFAGDMMFDRTIRAKAEEHSYDYLFSCISDYVSSFDTVVANLEGPITDYDSESRGTRPGEAGNTTFTFSPIVADTLFKNNIRMVNAGNNHSVDFGRLGATSTRMYLLKAGVNHFGSPGGSIVATTTIQGFRVAFVNFNQFLGLNDPSKTVRAIVSVRPSTDFIFVYTHWGDEYAPATEYEQTLSRDFIDAGADMVIGSHPHVIQEHVMYKGKHIFYSLGNFIFDQYFSEEVKTGAAVEVSLSKDGIEVKERRFELMRDGRTCLK